MERARDAGGAAPGERRRRSVLTASQLRVARYRVATRILELSEREALTLGETICELMRARRPPDTVVERKAAKLARERERLGRRLDQLYTQARQAQGELAEIIAQEVKNDALRERGTDDPYVRGLWTELSLLLAGDKRAIEAALEGWRRIAATLSL